jgi:3-oxoacyl-[acyl-carrier-protein] synthase II
MTSIEMWEGLCGGRCGIDGITSFDPSGFICKIAGQVGDYKMRDYVPKSHRKAVKLMSRDIELAVIAADEALRGSGLVTKAIDPDNINVEPERMAINLGAGLISCDLVEIAPAAAASATNGEFDVRKWGSRGIEFMTPLWLLKYLPNMLACHIGIIHDIQGPSNSITCAESSALLSISEACQIIERDDADIAVAGGAEAKVNPLVMARQCLVKRATVSSDPASACRPFDAWAGGSVFGEGAGVVVLETLRGAQERNAKIYAEVVGTGQSNNINAAYERLEPDGKGVRIAIEKALADAEIEPGDLGLIIPHGTGIAVDDLAESKAIEAVLGDAVGKTAVWPIKSMLSNTGAAAGALDVIAGTCAIAEGKIPAAKNCDEKAEGCNLNISTELQKKDVGYALCCSYTYGGPTAAVVLKQLNGDSVK